MKTPEEAAGFVRRPAHTEAEDWIVYHPEMTAAALMLYMRLRGAVMDPSSSAADWQKTTKFTVEQMTRLLPRGKNSPGGSPYASDRTIQRGLLLLMKIGALRRLDVPGSQIPVYDFPMHPPENHQGPTWGGAVGKAIRHGDAPEPSTSVIAVQGGEGCHLCRGVTPMSGEGDTYVTGGCHRCRGCGSLTSGAGVPKKLFKKNPPHQEMPAAREDEEDQDQRPAAVRKSDQEIQPQEDDRKAVKALLKAVGVPVQGHERKRVLEAVSTLRAASWTQAGIEALFSSTRWDRIVVPDRYLVKKLEKAVESEPEATPDEERDDELAALYVQREKQKAQIQACDGCGTFGRTGTGWHGHGDEDLRLRIFELENPTQAAYNRASNGVRNSG